MNSLSKGLALFLGGAIAGATAALLLTPKNGEELRKEMADLAADAKKRVQEYCEQVKHEIENAKCKVEGAVAKEECAKEVPNGK